MAEYWKSTPSYWCKFCSQYVKDTGIERKNHESSARHQNNIQRSLRDLHKNKERETRDQQRAKDEVARLNGLVGGGGGRTSAGIPAVGTKIIGVKDVTAQHQTKQSTAAQRKAHAEQLAALGVELPEELKKEVTGIGGWQTVSERVIEDEVPADRSLAGMLKQEEDNKDTVFRGVHKRKAEDEEEEEKALGRSRAWGSKMRTYPGASGSEEDGDLDALLHDFGKTDELVKKEEAHEDDGGVKQEDELETKRPLSAIPDVDAPSATVKQEDGEGGVVPPVVFKKRKMKK